MYVARPSKASELPSEAKRRYVRHMRNRKFAQAIAKAAAAEGGLMASKAAQRSHAAELGRVVADAAKLAEAAYRRDNPGAENVRVSKEIFALT